MIRIIEVGPRDGLQNEASTIPTDVKIAFVNALSRSRVDEIEVSAFVSPKWVPQLADADDVFSQIYRDPKIVYSALVPNIQGMERALVARVDKVSVFTAASETFNQKNINTSIAGSITRFQPVLHTAQAHHLRTRGYVSTAFWCPYEGQIAPHRVADVISRLCDLGVDEISIGDTIGKALPHDVHALLDVLLTMLPTHRIAMHFHDTYGRAISNIIAAWERGIEAFDSSIGGLGGCPYAPAAPGNVATTRVIHALRERGATIDIAMDALHHARDIIAPHITHALTDDA